MSSNLDCAVCISFTSCQDGDYFVLTKCGHPFHHNCIVKWCDQAKKSDRVPRCPICCKLLSLKELRKIHGLSVSTHDVIQSKIGTKSPDVKLKIIILGDAGTGKTCLLRRYTDRRFSISEEATIGIDFRTKRIEIGGKLIQLSMFDSAGQEQFHSITPNFTRGAHGALIVYDLADTKTFLGIEHWINFVREYAGDEATILICGNKCDKIFDHRAMEIGQELAKKLNIHFVPTSAKEALNVEAAFRYLTTEMMLNFQRLEDELVRKQEEKMAAQQLATSGNKGGGGGLFTKKQMDQQQQQQGASNSNNTFQNSFRLNSVHETSHNSQVQMVTGFKHRCC